jgi:hypothetical protein
MPMTEHLSDKNLVQLAKQQYETSQKSTIPTVLVSLPSKGLVYPASSPLRSGTIEMRYMTAYDEDILTNSSYIRAGVAIDNLLRALIVTNVSIDDLVIGDKDAMIIAARLHGYGPDYAVVITEPNTNNKLERVLNLQDLQFKPFELQSNENGEFTFKDSGIDIKFKFLCKREIESLSVEHALSDFLRVSIKEINGTRQQSDIDNFVRYQMTPGQSKKLRTYISNNMPGIKLDAEFQGDNGGTFTAGFQIGPDFFWF